MANPHEGPHGRQRTPGLVWGMVMNKVWPTLEETQCLTNITTASFKKFQTFGR